MCISKKCIYTNKDTSSNKLKYHMCSFKIFVFIFYMVLLFVFQDNELKINVSKWDIIFNNCFIATTLPSIRADDPVHKA